jgi:UDP-N-acetylglucosamine 2-epimerase (non-hydrolysing)
VAVLIDLIAGARPNFMKIAPIIRAMESRKAQGGALRYRLVHTGQHYDARMSGDFFEQLGIPEPAINLAAGSGTQAEQTAAIMTGYETLLSNEPSGLCLVVGDVTSTMACAIVAQKLHVLVAHVEGGIRSGDWTMPEEINRIVTEVITNWFFTTMIDTLLANLGRLRPPPFSDVMGLQPGRYFVITLHRPANVDAGGPFARMLEAIAAGTRGLPVIFPVHPRSAKTLQTLPGFPPSLRLVDPQPYLEFNWLVKHAKAVITDSGGITEEATVMGVPCLTLRDTNERPETIALGTNELIGTDPMRLKPALHRLFAGQRKKGSITEKLDGKTGERIVAALERLLAT